MGFSLSNSIVDQMNWPLEARSVSPRLIRLVANGAVGKIPSILVGLGRLVAGITVGIDASVALKVATVAGDLEVLALVPAPMVSVTLPRVSHHVPGRPGIVAASAVVVAPFGVTRHVAISADVVESLKVRILVALETGCLTVLAQERRGMDSQIYLLPHFG
jgi:hypothetical protein